MSRELPPLNALRAFEAAGRHQSFSRAAEELNVSHSSISRHVRGLEDRLGVQLFRDLPRGLELSQDGAAFLAQVSPAFDAIAHATERLAERPKGAISISAEPLFSVKWLVPNLHRFSDQQPDIEIEIEASSQLADVARYEADLAVRFVAEGGSYPNAELISDAPIYPYAAPSLMAEPASSPLDLLKYPLIRERSAAVWPRWFGQQGIDLAENTPLLVRRFSSVLAYEAAVSGQGILLHSEEVVCRDVAAGRLVKAYDVGVRDGGFQIVHSEGALRRKSVRLFRDWLLTETAQWRGRPLNNQPSG